ncbi:hypothetical protein [Flavobacterium psychrotrophum]|uniref:hypothetical protein n=1 Tax=Flavobacterium psychrotrophum TaxID=2294119 RepID=UPI000E30CD33|nr:hypothetical protein [Flavobacterium psychrotrophum]
MKKLVYTLAGFVTLLSISCSKDDDSNSNSGDTAFLPLKAGNYWVYDVSSAAQSERDSVYTNHDTIIGANSYKKIQTGNTTPSGFFSNVIKNNGIRKDGDALKLSGGTAVNFSAEFPFSIAVTDLVVFKESATAGQELGAVSGTVEQQYEGQPFTLTYKLTTIADQTLPSYSVGGHNYTNVKKVKAVVNLSITYSLEGFPVTVLTPQDVVTSYQYYAENIGVVNVETAFKYNIDPAIAAFLTIDPTTTQTQQEVLNTYNVQ